MNLYEGKQAEILKNKVDGIVYDQLVDKTHQEIRSLKA